MLAKHGPKPRPWVDLRTTIPPEYDRPLADLVALSGVSKATLVRRALAEMLSVTGVLPPDAPTEIQVSPTGGPGLAIHRKDKP